MALAPSTKRDATVESTRPASPLPARLLKKLGPGLITGASDDDPSGIATYSQAGAQFGYALLWTMLFSYPLMAAIQEISARVGRVTGHGIGVNMRKHCPRWMSYSIAALVFVANTINLGADVAAMGSALGIVLDGSAAAFTVGIVLLSVALQVWLPYDRYAPILKWMTISLFAYVGAAFFARVPWLVAIWHTLLPQMSFGSEYWMTLVAVLGTTISPYLFFWQASLEAEGIRLRADARPLAVSARGADREIRRIRIDTYVGMAVSNLVGFFIILTCAASLHSHGVMDIDSASRAAEALRPLGGSVAFALFTLGIVGTGLLAVPVLSGSAAYAVSGVAGWRSSLTAAPEHAVGFYSTMVAATVLGLAITFTSLNPIKALFWAAVINGIVAAPLMAVIMFLATDHRVMGKFVLPLPLKLIGWVATATMLVSIVALLVSIR